MNATRRTGRDPAGPRLSIPPREIAIANRHPRLRLERRAVVAALRALDAQHDSLATRHSTLARGGELSVVFLTDSALAQLHAAFLGDPSTTDVITFSGDPALGSAGEICVSVDTAARYAREHGREFSEELTLYLAHGWLHLAGHDDLVAQKKRAMRRAEARAMRALRAAHCIPRFLLAKGRS